MARTFTKDLQYYKFCSYGFLKNLRFFEPFLYLFFLSKGLTFFEIGTLVALREVVVNVLEIPAGLIADALGRRRTMMSAFLAYIISFSMFYFALDYWIFAVSFLFYGFGDAFRQGTHKSMIVDYLRMKGWNDQKTHYYGHTRSWSQIGSAVSSLVAAALVIITGNYQTVFLFSTIPYFLNLILIASYPAELDGAIVQHERNAFAKNFKQVFHDFRTSFRNPEVLKTIGNLSIYSGFYKAVKDYLQPVLNAAAISIPLFLYLKGEQRSAILIGIVSFLIYLSTALASRRSGRFSELFHNSAKPLNITLYIGFFTGIVAGIFYHYGFLLVAGLLFIFIYLVENLRKPIGIGHLTDQIDHHILSSSLSVQSQAETIIAAVLAPLLGLIADYEGIDIALISISCFMIIPALFLRIKSRDNNIRNKKLNS